MQPGEYAAGPLEDRLRTLILTSSSPEAMPDLESSNQPTFTSASHSTHVSQAKQESRNGQPHQNTMRPTPKPGKKRPNQAQRRQMNAELLIPADIGGHGHFSSKPLQHTHQQNPSSSSASGFPVNFQDRPWSDGNYSNGQSQQGYAQRTTFPPHQPDWKRQQHYSFDNLSRGVSTIPADAFPSRSRRHPTQSQPALYNPGGYRQLGLAPEQLANQSTFLDQLCYQVIRGAEIEPDEIAEKERFRTFVEAICQRVVTCHEHEVNGAREFQPEAVELKCFGSLASGFATKAADMDLGLLSPMSLLSPGSPESPVPRLIEGALLAAGFGARLLTKTRVPIIKLCEKPSTALRQSLLDARKKWENGVDQEEGELDDDMPEDPGPPLDIRTPIDTEPNLDHTKLGISRSSLDAKPVLPHEEEFSLKQSLSQSLSSYYGNAKRLLRRLNGRDINHSNCQDFTEANLILLDRVAAAFARGLYDANLRSRILAYRSFHIGDTAQLTNYRSLFGVNTIIEGEKLVLLWEARQLSGNSKADQAYDTVIQQWKDLQYNNSFGTTPLWFNKELQLAVDAIRRIPCVQFMQLRQEQHESPQQYHGRTNKIATALAGTSFPSADIGPYTIQYYIDGINDEKIRNDVRDFVALTGTQVLRTVARKHKSLQLAADYERAIEQGHYRRQDLSILQSYTTILRRKLVHSLQRPKDFEYLVPIMQNEMRILDNIRELPDPATLSPNKPKDKYNDGLEFPKSGVGVQCDINFSAHLALQNTLLLRCYSYTDPRVRPLVLFVKHWAKARGINTPYRGTLSSYGYVLMVLHYLINVVEPFVCPNLQELAPPDPSLPPHALEGVTICQGRNVRFWRDERAILNLAQQGQLNQNHDSVGTLLRGFFEYYAQSHVMVTLPKKGFDWGRDVISLRTRGGLLSKAEKHWTEAKTVIQPQTGSSPASAEPNSTSTHSPPLSDNTGLKARINQPPSPESGARPVSKYHVSKPKEVKEVRHRFLFAIEDPFELDHNVARTVTHNGIVAIRDEFRRAWRIIKVAGKGPVAEDLLEDVNVHKGELDRRQFMALLDEIHGDEIFGIQE
ncbi:hypothetical protein GQX73_g4762 [Xylaria multiplex]|uniref:polynucleotide adenylyltransferase n=1 Tax=Xylaria multiplex TaxID=323545 RepID=A0A7C8IPD1_9PEZI|nr:hypothetical protein GQX73_g4762 [Xylaria multiplex]